MAPSTGHAAAESDRRLIRDHSLYVREAVFSCVTQAQVECSVAFARYLSLVGLNAENYKLFLRLVMTNNPWVIDELLHDREPRLLFSTIRPDAELIEAAFQTLFSRHPEELYPRALESLLGIVQNAYFDPDDGYRIRRLSIMDINALGKFLLKDEPQEHPQNRLVLEILDRLTKLGEYYQEPDKSVLSKHAFNVRFAYFDQTRELLDAIPEPLLIRVPDRNGVRPEEDFADLVKKRRERKRDRAGRFVRDESSEISVEPGVAAAVAVPIPDQDADSRGPDRRYAESVSEAESPARPAAKPAAAGNRGASKKSAPAVRAAAAGTRTKPVGGAAGKGTSPAKAKARPATRPIAKGKTKRDSSPVARPRKK